MNIDLTVGLNRGLSGACVTDAVIVGLTRGLSGACVTDAVVVGLTTSGLT